MIIFDLLLAITFACIINILLESLVFFIGWVVQKNWSINIPLILLLITIYFISNYSDKTPFKLIMNKISSIEDGESLNKLLFLSKMLIEYSLVIGLVVFGALVANKISMVVKKTQDK